MKRVLTSAILGLSLVTGSVAMADSDHNRNRDHRAERRDDHRDARIERRDDKRDARIERRDDRRDFRNERRDDRRDFRNERRNDSRDYRHDNRPRYRYENGRYRYGASVYYRPHGYYVHSWRRGERLPVAYYGPRYIVSDYYSYNLRRPPYGYHWVRVNNDVVLAAIAGGIVADVVYNLFY